MPALEDLDYKIGDSAFEVSFDEFESSQVDFCNYSWEYALSTATDPIGGAEISSYIKFSEKPLSAIIHVESGNGAQAQALQIILSGTLDNDQVFSKSFSVTYTDPTVSVFEADSNIMPEFSEEIEAYFPIDFSGSEA